MRKVSVVAVLAVSLCFVLSCSGKEAASKEVASDITPVPAGVSAESSAPEGDSETGARSVSPDDPERPPALLGGGDGSDSQADANAGKAAPAARDGGLAEEPQGAGDSTAVPSPAEIRYELGRVGYIVNYRGEITVRRGQEVISGDAIDFGFELHAYDLISTGPKSYAEVDLNASYAGGSFIRLSERTNFWFDLGSVAEDGSMETDIRLLAGAIALKVEKLSSRGRVQVSSESAVFGVRGTEFIVTLGPEASTLVTCIEGRVACEDETGTVYDAVPGQAVEKRFDAPVRVVPKNPEELGPWRTAWLDERTEEFYSDPARYVSPYAAQVRKWGPGFDAAAAALEKHQAIWGRWAAAVAAGNSYSFVELGTDKKRVNNDLFAAARELFYYEAAHYRLMDMINRLGRPVQGYAVQALPVELAEVRKELERRELRLARVREIFMLYGTVSNGSPLGDFFLERSESSGGNL